MGLEEKQGKAVPLPDHDVCISIQTGEMLSSAPSSVGQEHQGLVAANGPDGTGMSTFFS